MRVSLMYYLSKAGILSKDEEKASFASRMEKAALFF
jgi:hypothetical protein